MAKNSTNVLTNMAAEDGSSLAKKAKRDQFEEVHEPLLEEDGLPSIKGFWRRGMHLTIYAVPYFYRGVWLGEDDEHHYLAPGAMKVYDTGPLEQFQKQEKATTEEPLIEMVAVRKGSINAVSPFPKK